MPDVYMRALTLASTALVLRRFANFTEGTGSVRFVGVISVDRCMERRSAPLEIRSTPLVKCMEMSTP